MLRMSIAAALVLMATSAFAQHVEADKSLKFGAGCVGPVSTLAPRLGTCTIEGTKSRIWCPNGKVYDRHGEVAYAAVVRSMCELNQVL